jgi:predicted nucleic acid-binding protein
LWAPARDAATRDRHHTNAVELLTTAPRPLIVPALVVTEVSYLLADRIGPNAEVAFARALAAAELLRSPAVRDGPATARRDFHAPALAVTR